ncbi:hypothetical protein H8S95_05310 [Pontibacter sp. KCTC 32443]|uniref:hypothetical protein n=1 Tax=Pontibacter TaxID=323449 RepID=UPI00164D6228|nr:MULTISPECIES: hypothetical protein [Pontibacter]MBC5773474.1 hypothetical protein [Pontibacter sp. KCTC 32443]
MEDFKVIFYILLAVGYFLFSFFRKYFKEDHSQPKKFRDENEPPVTRPHQRPPVPVTSFEDILRELQPKAEQAKVLETKRLEQTITPVVTVESPKVSTYEHKAPEAVSLEQLMPKRTPIERKASFEPYTIKPTTTLRKFDPSILRNPTTARDAFILSEIFNRRY